MIRFRHSGRGWAVAAVILAGFVRLGLVQGMQAEPIESLTWKPTKLPNLSTFEYRPDETKTVIKGLVNYPDSIGPFRVVILNHSPKGSAAQATYHYGPKLMERGYAVIAVDLEYGIKIEESDWEEIFRRLSACIEVIERDEKLDSKKIFMFGNGPGAMVTLAFAAQSDRLKAVGMTGGGLLPKDGVKYEKISAPLLMVHGADDETVPIDTAMKLKANLERAGKAVEIKVIEKSGHEMITLRAADVFDAVAAFFNKYSK